MDNIYFDSVVVGGGVIGLASALELQLSGQKVLLVEKNNFIADETSSRNSGVIHSGIYYPKDSLKKFFCIKGNKLLYDFCEKHEVLHKKTGKLIVANQNEEDKLVSIYENGLKNGLKSDIELIDGNQTRNLEQNLSDKISLAIHVKSTGIVDQPAFCQKLQFLFEKNGGQLTKNTEFYNYTNENSTHISFLNTLNERFKVQSKSLILCSGLKSFETGCMIKQIRESSNFYKLKFVKGHYFKHNSKRPLFNRLIYPIPNNLGLGIHYTLDVNGYGKFGPDTVIVDKIDYRFNCEDLKNKFIDSIRGYSSKIESNELSEDYTGIRPRLAIDEKFIDFSILDSQDHGINNLLFLQGFESPGLTSSLAISEYIAKKLI
tara:strand:+ start:3659 stop:4780 length:1122 start_codon:yes stop_codon:yes gene_type:complete